MEFVWVAITVFILVVILITTVKYEQFLFRKTYSSAAEEHTQLVKALQTHVYVLSHKIGIRDTRHYGKLNEAADYITQKFTELGYKIEVQNYDADGQIVKNVIAVKPGTAKPEETIVIGAHYDSAGNPGADDNASGVSALIELARSIAGHNTRKNIEFVAFVNEEPPFFHTNKMGSWVYTKDAKETGKNITAGLVLEMLGYYSNEVNSQRYPQGLESLYPDKANFVAIVSNHASDRLAAQVITSFKKKTPFPMELIDAANVPEGDFSDHWSFWQEGYPAIMVTDTSFYRYNHYHQQSDTYEKLNYHSMSEVVQGLSAVITDLSK